MKLNSEAIKKESLINDVNGNIVFDWIQTASV
jgi:hypothetical protein